MSGNEIAIMLCLSILMFPGSIIIFGLLKMTYPDKRDRQEGREIVEDYTGIATIKASRKYTNNVEAQTGYRDLYKARHDYRVGKLTRDEFEKVKTLLDQR